MSVRLDKQRQVASVVIPILVLGSESLDLRSQLLNDRLEFGHLCFQRGDPFLRFDVANLAPQIFYRKSELLRPTRLIDIPKG